MSDAKYVIATYGDGHSARIVLEHQLDQAWLEAHFCPVDGITDEQRVDCLAALHDESEWLKYQGVKLSLSVRYEDGGVQVLRITDEPAEVVIPSFPPDRVRKVWAEIIGNMSADNGHHYKTTEDDFDEAAPVIDALMKAGFFQDDANDLDGSFWKAASPEFTEAPQYFSRRPDAYRHLAAILTRIFERPDPNELPAWWDQFILNICEIPDRTSPDDEPSAMIATADELASCAINAMEKVIA